MSSAVASLAEETRDITDVYEPTYVYEPTSELVAEFFDLKDTQLVIREGKFIAEGSEPLKLLLKNKWGIQPTKILVKPSAFERLKDDISASAFKPAVFVMPGKKMAETVGYYGGSRGVFCCGIVPKNRTFSWLLDNVLTAKKRKWRILAIDGSNNTANLGSMVRCASAFGIHAILLSTDCCDPFYRQSVRVSMGHVFNVPIVRVENLSECLHFLSTEHAVKTFAAVIDQDSTFLKSIAAPLQDRWCVILGNEDKGVSDAVRGISGIVKLRIDIAPGVDSLSITNATAVLLNGLREREAEDMW